MIYFTDHGKKIVQFLLRDTNDDALINSAEDITLMTLAGKKTHIEVISVEEINNMLLLCQLETNLDHLVVLFEEDYKEIINILLQIIKLKNLKVCFILLKV